MPREKVLKFQFKENYKIVSDWIKCVDLLREGFLDFRILQNTKLIAINAAFGKCSDLSVKLEKNRYIDENHQEYKSPVNIVLDIKVVSNAIYMDELETMEIETLVFDDYDELREVVTT